MQVLQDIVETGLQQSPPEHRFVVLRDFVSRLVQHLRDTTRGTRILLRLLTACLPQPRLFPGHADRKTVGTDKGQSIFRVLQNVLQRTEYEPIQFHDDDVQREELIATHLAIMSQLGIDSMTFLEHGQCQQIRPEMSLQQWPMTHIRSDYMLPVPNQIMKHLPVVQKTHLKYQDLLVMEQNVGRMTHSGNEVLLHKGSHVPAEHLRMEARAKSTRKAWVPQLLASDVQRIWRTMLMIPTTRTRVRTGGKRRARASQIAQNLMRKRLLQNTREAEKLRPKGKG